MKAMPMSLDPIQALKKRAYARSFGGLDTSLTVDDLVIMARAYLSRETHTLYNNPIWDEYTKEEIIIEYFSYRFVREQDLRETFEKEHNVKDAEKEGIYDWLEEQAQSDGDAEPEFEESIDFDPREV